MKQGRKGQIVKIMYRYLLSFLVVPVCLFGNALAQLNSFQRAIGGGQIDYVNSLKATTDGGYILGGSTRSGISGSDFDALLIKTDGDGNMQWNKTYGGVAREEIRAVVGTSDGGYIFCGETDLSSNNQRGLVIRTDSGGDTLWARKFGQSRVSLKDVIQTSDGGFLCSGSRLHTTNRELPFAMKLDPFGNVLWSKVYSETSNSGEFNSVLELSPGIYVAAGYHNESLLITKLNSAGDTLWQKGLSRNGTDSAMRLKRTSDGGFIWAVTTQFTITGVPTAHGGLIKLDVNGNILWQTYVSSNPVILYDVEETMTGNYVAVAAEGGSQNNRLVLIQFSSTGNFVWAFRYLPFGPAKLCGATTILEQLNGHFVTAGFANPSVQTTPDDVFLMQTDASGSSGCNEAPLLYATSVLGFVEFPPNYPVTSVNASLGSVLLYQSSLTLSDTLLCSLVGVNLPAQSDFNVSPNPATDRVHIKLEGFSPEYTEVQLADCYGKIVRTCHLQQGTVEAIMPCGDLSSGVYLVYLIKDGQRSSVERLALVR